jgi:hypothetical protein
MISSSRLFTGSLVVEAGEIKLLRETLPTERAAKVLCLMGHEDDAYNYTGD